MSRYKKRINYNQKTNLERHIKLKLLRGQQIGKYVGWHQFRGGGTEF
jgi:hypothetical protein